MIDVYIMLLVSVVFSVVGILFGIMVCDDTDPDFYTTSNTYHRQAYIAICWFVALVLGMTTYWLFAPELTMLYMKIFS